MLTLTRGGPHAAMLHHVGNVQTMLKSLSSM